MRLCIKKPPGRQSGLSARWLRGSERLAELIENRRVLQRRHVLRDGLALRERAQQAAHDLARTRLRQVLAEANVLRLGDRTDLLADPRAQFVGELHRFL